MEIIDPRVSGNGQKPVKISTDAQFWSDRRVGEGPARTKENSRQGPSAYLAA
ncbi:MAG: hypothetical protein AB1555_04480 [Nitrospirota bacterium]